MTTAIVQSLWGSGMMHGDDAASAARALKTHCLPSVQRYAARHGYSYILHRPKRLHFSIPLSDETQFFKVGEFDKRVPLHTLLPKDVWNSVFEPYYVMNELSNLYDGFIYLDADVYIKPNAPAMPYQKGVWAFNEYHLPYAHTVQRGFDDVPKTHRFNSGVLVMDSSSARDFYDYLKKVTPDERCTGDQDYFRLWSLKNKVQPLEEQWNHITAFHERRDGYFIHYVDKDKMALELAHFHVRFGRRLYHFLKAGERRLRRTPLYQLLRARKKGRNTA